MRRIHRNGILALISLSLIGLIGCGDNSNSSTNSTPKVASKCTSDFVSGLPTLSSNDLYVIKLSHPSLIESSYLESNGRRIIDEKAKQRLLTEQENFKKTIKKLYPELKIVFEYKHVLNAFAVYGSSSTVNSLADLNEVKSISASLNFARPTVMNEMEASEEEEFKGISSVDFINANKVHDLMIDKDGQQIPITGLGTTVGVIDTGIDYTHSMFSGEGTAEAYKVIDPKTSTPSFPTVKVVGGYDFAGTDYNSGGGLDKHKLPVPDSNPIDEGGHGTHVAGTIAGVGDNKNTYSGVAPDAKLYALKVFGANGSTSDAVVIKALEFSADPNEDFDYSDRLDVVNLSLGGGFGDAHNLYSEAIKNLVVAGTVTITAAGNSDAVDNIVGAPSTSEDAISVAATIDAMEHNWKFAASAFEFSKNENKGDIEYQSIVEGDITTPVKKTNVNGELFFIGLADTDLSEDVKLKLKGKVALIVRGKVTFVEKINRAFDAGAIGVVMVNNQPGDPIAMGGELEKPFPIPGIMVNADFGQKLIDSKAPVKVTFKTDHYIERPELIDTITSFSSKGPRIQDSLIKPEVSAPGQQILSAAMGGGKKGVKMNGTSMATPHIAGVAALLRQKYPNDSNEIIKSLIINNTQVINNASTKDIYLVSRQGGGRIDSLKAATTSLVSLPATLSLGEVGISDFKVIKKSLTLKNLSSEISTNYQIQFKGDEHINYQGPKEVNLLPSQQLNLDIAFNLTLPKEQKTPVIELDGHLVISNESDSLNIPVLAVAQKASKVRLTDVSVSDKVATLKLQNSSNYEGFSALFNLLDEDEAKIKTANPNMSNASLNCDLESVGYKVIEKTYELEEGKKETFKVLQVAFKTYTPQTNWNDCSPSLLIDANDDGVADIEATGLTEVVASQGLVPAALTYLIDANKARQIRYDFDKALQESRKKGELPTNLALNYLPSAIDALPFIAFNHGSFALLEVRLSALPVKNNKLKVLAVTTHRHDNSAEFLDWLNGSEDQWKDLNITENLNVDEVSIVKANSQEQVLKATVKDLKQKLIAYFPMNESSLNNSVKARQSVVIDLNQGLIAESQLSPSTECIK